MSKFVTLVLEPRFNDEYGEYANLPVFNAHGEVVGYTGGEVPEAGNPCEFYVMDEEGFPVCHSASENVKLRSLVRDMHKALFSLNLDHCQACPREDACVFTHKSFDCDECAFERDMRELGIEVDR